MLDGLFASLYGDTTTASMLPSRSAAWSAAMRAVAATEVEEIVEAQWKDLGMPETLWHCHVKEFGPLIVSIDSYGRNYFEEKKVEYNQKKDEQVELISRQVGFIK